MSWHALSTDYAAYLRAAGRRPETVTLRVAWLRRAARQLPGPADCTRGDIVRWLAGQDWGPETRRSALGSLRGFFAWAVAEELLDRDPTVGLPAVPCPPGTARPAPEPVVRDTLRHTDRRVRTVMVLSARMGLRRGEIARAAVEHVSDGQLLVHGKGGKRRLVPVHPALEPLLPASGPLVPSLLDGGHLTPAHIGVLMRAALPTGVTCHMMRHRFASVSYRATRDLRATQEVLGHASLATTQRYVDTGMDDRRRAVESA